MQVTRLGSIFRQHACSILHIGLLANRARTNGNLLEQLRIQSKRASSTLVTKTAFLSTVRHELRTLLTGFSFQYAGC